MATSLSTWRGARGCAGAGTTQASGSVRSTTWICVKTTTRYTVIAGADHPWTVTSTTGMDATSAAWDFIDTH